MLETETESAKLLPDVASEPHVSTLGVQHALVSQFKDLTLDWVGMKEIEVPIQFQELAGRMLFLSARVDAGVSLDSPGSRGIHMSRLYKEVQDRLSAEPLSFALLDQVLNTFLQSHQGLSHRAEIAVKFELPLKRKALKSELSAWRTYPVSMSASKGLDQATRFFSETVVTYSSTCPASAALARQLIQDNFRVNFTSRDLDFSDVHQWLGSSEGVNATPHAQRSLARVKVQMISSHTHLPPEVHPMEKIINLIEAALQTPVQGMVKREDEQEFALRNGQNLMFCEDAGRRLKLALLNEASVLDFCAELRHLESLHPHDAVSHISKGLDLKV